MRVRKTLGVVLVGVLAAVAGPQAPVEAADATGTAFEGVANLPKFPCPVTSPCTADFGGTLSGQIAGEQFGPFEATIADADVSATAVYQDQSCSIGTAAGTATVSADLGEVFGVYLPDAGPGPLPVPIIGLDITIDFTWQRVGATAVLFFANGVVTADIPGMLDPMVVMGDASGVATAGFVPHFDPNNQPDCDPRNIPPTNTPPITADVIGNVLLADDTLA